MTTESRAYAKPPAEELRAGAGLLRQIVEPRSYGREKPSRCWLTPSDVTYFADDWQRIAGKLEEPDAGQLREMAANLREKRPGDEEAERLAVQLEQIAERSA